MDYSDKQQLFSDLLIKKCKEIITENYNKYENNSLFIKWIYSYSAAMDIGYNYQNICKIYFEKYMNKGIENQLWFAGKNIIYAIQTFINMKNNNYNLHELLNFIDIFIIKQLEQFDNDYDTTNWN